VTDTNYTLFEGQNASQLPAQLKVSNSTFPLQDYEKNISESNNNVTQYRTFDTNNITTFISKCDGCDLFLS